MTAKAATPSKEGQTRETPAPTDLSHIRVGPPFESKQRGRCFVCSEATLGRTCAIVENTRTDKRKAIHEEPCLADRPDLLARRESNDPDAFLA